MLEPETSNESSSTETGTEPVRVCSICNLPLPVNCHGLRKYHASCAKKALEIKIEEQRQRREMGKKVTIKNCAICNTEFRARSIVSKYCTNPECKAIGLARKIVAYNTSEANEIRGPK